MKILHILRNREELPIEIAGEQSREHEVSLLLMHDAVLWNPDVSGIKVYVSLQDVRARGIASEHEMLDYGGIVGMIFAHERVISW
ncbi:MAG TPA: hypothetical protein HA257_03590 [Candidatus Methanoperedenaceae archaeon]|nr:hypothetical protein [Candidatus Methanoperedenaceae archaeon]